MNLNRTNETATDKLWRTGAAGLSIDELLAVIFRRPEQNDVKAIAEALSDYDMRSMSQLSAIDFQNGSPLEEGDTESLLAVVEFARRLARARVRERAPADNPARLASYLAMRYQDDQMKAGAVFLDGSTRIVHDCVLFSGSADRASISPAPIIKTALKVNAVAFAVFITHPSGNSSPSPEDTACARRLKKAGEIVGIELLDLLVLGSPGDYKSLLDVSTTSILTPRTT